MLLPSDVARLVLGYLQEEGLTATSRVFIQESPDLKEYADYTSGDGSIPACVFSMFGKSLTTILNEYVGTKAKESSQEVPLVMTSLWKKLDFTLNQIKSLQNSPVVSANRRRDLSLPVSVTEARQSSGPTSPGRRKWETPRKRSGAPCGSNVPPKSTNNVCSQTAEPLSDEATDDNSSQRMIENARDKILGDKILQEKLAENINKILANEPTPQTSKASTNTVEPDQSIDEILGLQGEIHMSDDAIRDILDQTESDPAFRDLFDLFDYHKTKVPNGETGNEGIDGSSEDNHDGGLSSTIQTLQNDCSGATQKVLIVPESTPTTPKTRTVQENETSKSSAPTVITKTLDFTNRLSRTELSCPRYLKCYDEHQPPTSASLESGSKKNPSHSKSSCGVTQEDIAEPLNTPSQPIDCLPSEEVIKESSFTKLRKSTLSKDSSTLPSNDLISNVEKKQGHEQVLESNRQPTTRSSSALRDSTLLSSSGDKQLDDTPSVPVSSSRGNALPGCALEVQSAPGSATLTATPFSLVPTPEARTPTSASTTATVSAAATSLASSNSCSQVATTFSSSSTSPSNAAEDPGIVSFQIIITDEQGVECSSNTALNQAIANISGDTMPTTYSSPAKTPGRPVSPNANFEVAQAVSGLQSSEAAGALLASPLTGTSQAQQKFIIQVPVDPANCLQGSTANYILVAPTPDLTARQVLVPVGVPQGQTLASNQWSMMSPTKSQSYNTGSTLILNSPTNPVVLPVSVLGQNTLTNVQVVSNQLVGKPKPLQLIQAKPASVKNPTSDTEKNLSDKVSQQENVQQQEVAKDSNHRRILCFDSSSLSEGQSQTAETSAPVAGNTSRSKSIQHSEKNKRPQNSRTIPTILAGNKPLRRIKPIRCSSDSQPVVGFMKDAELLKTQQKETAKKSSRKQEHKNQKEFYNDSIETFLQSEPVDVTELVVTTTPTNIKKSPDPSNADRQCSTSLSSDLTLNLESGKDKENSGKECAKNVSLKPHEERTEKRTSRQAIPNVKANKENKMTSSSKEQHPAAPSSSASRDLSPPAVTQPKVLKAPSKTSSLAKQAAEMLQDLQGLNSPSTPVKKPGASSSDHLLSGAGHGNEATPPKTPAQKMCKERDGTPQHAKLPNTPDIPTCSPASEVGSETSVNMAAHTLMILSRAAISRTSTPLKDSLRQEEVEDKSSQSPKISRKRKLSLPVSHSPAKRGSKQSSRQRDREKKTPFDCFPQDLDVDKFLSSLHYDE